ncbi:MAG: hypothetical protein ACTS3R_00405 [Inquilinaceae bacterium]
MNPTQRAWRILKPMPSFHASFKDGLPAYASSLCPGEEIVGVYENTPGIALDSVIIMNDSIAWYEDGKKVQVKFDEIESVRAPATKELSDSQCFFVRITTGGNGRELHIPIRGHSHRFLDSFEFTRFMARVVSDMEKFPNA